MGKLLTVFLEVEGQGWSVRRQLAGGWYFGVSDFWELNSLMGKRQKKRLESRFEEEEPSALLE